MTGLTYRTALAEGEAGKNDVIEKVVAYLKGKNIDMGEDKLKTRGPQRV